MRFDFVLRYFSVGLIGLVLGGCASPRAFTPVQIEGVQHLGPDYNISQFYIDGASGGNVGRGGGGGGGPCCANLPDKWYPGMKSVVRWGVNDWVRDTGYYYRATVLVEKYDQVGRIYVHFFPGGKVRVVVATAGSTNKDHPIPYGPHDDATATKGVEVETLFTKEELEERDRQDREYKKKHGDWR